MGTLEYFYGLEMMAGKAMQSRTLRTALGCFTTGVTVVTTCDQAGNIAGMTVNSFASVSLEPPLVLWSVDKSANSFKAFSEANYFAIHVLHAGQEAVSHTFATPRADKFSCVPHEQGLGGIPRLTDYSACFECKTRHRYDGGDHTILVGEIIHFHSRDKEPLVFYKGAYKKLA